MISLRPIGSDILFDLLVSFRRLTNHVHGIQYVLNSTFGTDWYISSSVGVRKPVGGVIFNQSCGINPFR